MYWHLASIKAETFQLLKMEERLCIYCEVYVFCLHFWLEYLIIVSSHLFCVSLWQLEKENLCLYGHPSETWEVNLPAEEVPPELPEPALGINFARDGMNRRDWLSLVAVHSDCWLLSVAFYFGARLNRNERYAFLWSV